MNKKNQADNKRKYDIYRHHAWAGSVLLAILLAVRIFFETSGIRIEDWIILIIGTILVIYTLIAVLLTYKYRSGLNSEQKIIQVQASNNQIKKEEINAKLEKERIKLEKKKAKAEAKKEKKELK